jgi:perosamine synthetase
LKVPLAKIEIDSSTIEAAVAALKSGQWLHGPRSVSFEEKFAHFCNTKYACSCSSGTTALFLALKSLGIKKGDEVIVPSFSFVASASSISMCDAIPKFVDIDPINFTIDPKQIEKNITKNTKAIMPVHLFGHPADMDPILEIAKKFSLYVIEDSAQAHGAKYKEKLVGSIGDISCFSFYPTKNLTVCGDGGMITSQNKKLNDSVKILRNHGRKEKYVHEVLGYNFKLSEIQAGIGISRLVKLNKNNLMRRKIAKIYNSELTDKIKKPVEESWAKHVYHQYSIQTKFRNELKDFLAKKNISTAVYYPMPIHKQPMYKKFNKQKLDITEKLSSEILSLPIYPTMKDSEINYVVTNINKFFQNRKL